MSLKNLKFGLRRRISRLPGGASAIRCFQNLVRSVRFGSPKKLFSHYYESNEWDDGESISGPGSTLEYTENIRKEIPGLVEELGVTSMLDAPCGDYNWFGEIEWKNAIDYTGGDIVEAMIGNNQEKYGGEKVRFIPLDITRDELPEVELWLCRDCLFHLSNADVFRALDNFLRSKISYLLTTTHPRCDKNLDISTGSFRLINLEREPFELGPPKSKMDDWIDNYPERYLALWEKEAVREALEKNEEFLRATSRKK